MGLLDEVTDKMTNAETVRISYSELAEKINQDFIKEQQNADFDKILKTAKGGFLIEKNMTSADGRYTFHVGTRPHGLVWLNSKPAWIFDKQERRFYQLDKNYKWKHFYNAVKNIINSK